MSPPILDFDVLQRMMEIQVLDDDSPKAIVPITQTCRTLQESGARLLLHSGPYIKTSSALDSFCLFMRANENRSHHLRQFGLHLDLEHMPPDLQPFNDLSVILQQATRLTKLFLYNPAFLVEYPMMSETVTGLTGLTTLSLAGRCGNIENLRDVLSHFKSTIRKASVELLGTDVFDPDPIQVLEGLSSHLEHVRVFQSNLHAKSGAVFPRVESLTCETPAVVEQMLPLVRAFPNLLSLTYNLSTMVYQLPEEQCRAFNLHLQRSMRWQHLTHLRGHLWMLYALAVQCPVTTLEVSTRHFAGYLSHDMEVVLPVVLHDCSPTNLMLHVASDYDLLPLGTALRRPTSPLENLAIRARPSWSRKPLGMTHILEGLLAVLEGSGLKYIRISLDRDEITMYGETLRTVPAPDLATYARHFMERIETLETIVLHWQSSPFAAVVEEKGGIRSLSVLNETTAGTLALQVEGQWYPSVPWTGVHDEYRPFRMAI